MDIVLVEFTTVNKRGVEQYIVPLRDAILLGRTKDGCCVQTNDGCVYDAINDYDDVKKTLVDNGIKVIELPVPNVQD